MKINITAQDNKYKIELFGENTEDDNLIITLLKNYVVKNGDSLDLIQIESRDNGYTVSFKDNNHNAPTNALLDFVNELQTTNIDELKTKHSEYLVAQSKPTQSNIKNETFKENDISISQKSNVLNTAQANVQFTKNLHTSAKKSLQGYLKTTEYWENHFKKVPKTHQENVVLSIMAKLFTDNIKIKNPFGANGITIESANSSSNGPAKKLSDITFEFIYRTDNDETQKEGNEKLTKIYNVINEEFEKLIAKIMDREYDKKQQEVIQDLIKALKTKFKGHDIYIDDNYIHNSIINFRNAKLKEQQGQKSVVKNAPLTKTFNETSPTANKPIKSETTLNATSQSPINKQDTMDSQSTAPSTLSGSQDSQKSKETANLSNLNTIIEETELQETDESQAFKLTEENDTNATTSAANVTTSAANVTTSAANVTPSAVKVNATLRKNPIQAKKTSAVNIELSQRNIKPTEQNNNPSVAQHNQQNLSSSTTPNSATSLPVVEELKLKQAKERDEALKKAEHDFKTASETLENTEKTETFKKWQEQHDKNLINNINIDNIDTSEFNETEKNYINAIKNLETALNVKNDADQKNKKDTSEVKGNSNISKTTSKTSNPSLLDKLLKSPIGSNLIGRKVYTEEENNQSVDTHPQDNSDNESVRSISRSVSSLSLDNTSESSSEQNLPGRFGSAIDAIGKGFSLLNNGLRAAASRFYIPSFTNYSDTTISIHNLSVTKQKFFDNIKNEVEKYNKNEIVIKDSPINIPAKGKALTCKETGNTLIITEEPDDGSGTLISKDVQPKQVMKVIVDEEKNTANINHTGDFNLWIISLQSMILSGQNECSFKFNENHEALAKNFLDSYEHLYWAASKKFTPKEIKDGKLEEFKAMLNNITFKFENQETKQAISNALNDTNNKYNNVKTLFGIEVDENNRSDVQKQNNEQIQPARPSINLSSGP